MSQLAKYAAKHKMKVKKDEPAKKSKVKSVDCPDSTKTSVDEYLRGVAMRDEAAAIIAEASGDIVDFSLDHALKARSMANITLEGDEGAVNVNFKEQYSLKDREPLDKLLKKKGLNPDDFVSTETKMVFDFDKMSEKEREKLFGFLAKEFGGERFGELVAEKTSYKITGLKDQMPLIAKNRADLDVIREASGHFTPTVARRK